MGLVYDRVDFDYRRFTNHGPIHPGMLNEQGIDQDQGPAGHRLVEIRRPGIGETATPHYEQQ